MVRIERKGTESMTQHDKISAYIDNELTHEAEQDFLISLASNDGVRKAFRSELVMKSVIHQDELATLPNRDLRGAILATIGVGAASAVAGEASATTVAVANPSAIGLKALFATKLNALITVGIVSVSAIGGYVTNTIVHSTDNTVVTAPATQRVAPVLMNSPATTIETPFPEPAVAIEAPTKKVTAPTKAPLPKPTTNATTGTISMPAGLQVDITTKKNAK
jgi:negative regulator of sigma E activity